MADLRSFLAVLVGALAVGCAETSSSPEVADDALVANARPIANEDFADPLDRMFIRGTQTSLSDASFASKWDASRESAVIFMRSYPAAYHEDLVQLNPRHVIGEEGLCFGDAHPDNFGFIHIGNRTKFVFNDLDDSGHCPVALDAARYFAVLRLYFDDPSLTKDVLGQYVDTVGDLGRASEIDEDLLPDWSKVASKELEENVRDGKLVLGGEVSAPSAAERGAVRDVVAGDARIAGRAVLDIASVARAAGGSAGLRRYRVLVTDKAGAQTILELKEASTPGVDSGRQATKLGFDERLPVLKNALWSTTAQNDYFYVKVLGSRFLVRDRLAKKSVKLANLDKDQRKRVLRAQASVMARLHAPRWKNVKMDALRSWLDDSSKVLAERWTLAQSTKR